MAFVDLPITISPVTEEEAVDPITLVVTCAPGQEFPEGSVVTLNGAEGISPTVTDKRTLTCSVPNATRAVGLYAVQVRFPDARVTPPATLEITAAA